MEALRNNCMDGNKLKEASLEQILATVKDAYVYLHDFDDQEAAFRNEIMTWFGQTSWNLGRQAKYTPYYRHHFFKFSYKYLLLLCKPELEEDIETAMLAVMESGLDLGKNRSARNRIPYVRILQSNVETASDFYSAAKQSKRTALVNLLEFHSWVTRILALN